MAFASALTSVFATPQLSGDFEYRIQKRHQQKPSFDLDTIPKVLSELVVAAKLAAAAPRSCMMNKRGQRAGILMILSSCQINAYMTFSL
jgi:hypothetical protein